MSIQSFQTAAESEAAVWPALQDQENRGAVCVVLTLFSGISPIWSCRLSEFDMTARRTPSWLQSCHVAGFDGVK